MPWINEIECSKCLACVKSCPENAIKIKDNGFPYIDQNICIKCGKCFDACPKEVIRPNSENPSLRSGSGRGRGMGRNAKGFGKNNF
ncbi:ferredoxin [Tepiditoga spiralis]|uniref:Ferredoxin n=1 Tax=Tepiditoga spiralis TaxID=2108365 RepID=A0A7G1G8B4_9BACT|nr:4Fe-4S dicluster domain-containing protein [Tepiditoga spiralis]BBE31187.1 ferredoxin [Tepiditoga spiralis]